MRLINTSTYELEEFPDERNLQYAILSHRWEKEELLYQDMVSKRARERSKMLHGFRKLTESCRVAAAHGIKLIWIDTCCIDKSSSAELQEAINSMFRWYHTAELCLAYLSDISIDPKNGLYYVEESEWFNRGWTLQELLAPENLLYYSREWDLIGNRKHYRVEEVSKKTAIPISILKSYQHQKPLPFACIMTWAINRQTTRVEDQAYSLLGLLRINMPTLYGEGNNAFKRLQQEYLRNTADQSVLAGNSPSPEPPRLFAASPAEFLDFQTELGGRDILSYGFPEITLGNGRITTEMEVALLTPDAIYATLNCMVKVLSSGPAFPAIFLRYDHTTNCFYRISIDGKYFKFLDHSELSHSASLRRVTILETPRNADHPVESESEILQLCFEGFTAPKTTSWKVDRQKGFGWITEPISFPQNWHGGKLRTLRFALNTEFEMICMVSKLNCSRISQIEHEKVRDFSKWVSCTYVQSLATKVFAIWEYNPFCEPCYIPRLESKLDKITGTLFLKLSPHISGTHITVFERLESGEGWHHGIQIGVKRDVETHGKYKCSLKSFSKPKTGST